MALKTKNMSKLNLYNINKEHLAIVEQLVENEGELTVELKEALTINEKQLKEKGVSYAYVIKSMGDDIGLIDNEIKRLEKLKEAKKKAAERLKDVLKNAFQLHGITKVETATIKVSLRESKSVRVDDLALLDKKWTKTSTPEPKTTADKKAIKAAIENKETVIGAVLEINQNIKIT